MNTKKQGDVPHEAQVAGEHLFAARKLCLDIPPETSLHDSRLLYAADCSQYAFESEFFKQWSATVKHSQREILRHHLHKAFIRKQKDFTGRLDSLPAEATEARQQAVELVQWRPERSSMVSDIVANTTETMVNRIYLGVKIAQHLGRQAVAQCKVVFSVDQREAAIPKDIVIATSVLQAIVRVSDVFRTMPASGYSHIANVATGKAPLG